MAFDLLTNYFDLQAQIFAYFGYEEDWGAIPLDDNTKYYWMLDQKSDGTGDVFWAPEPFSANQIELGEYIYGGTIYTQRFLPKWVYSGLDYTMICVDSHTDQNKFLMVFANDNRCEDATLIALAQACWNT